MNIKIVVHEAEEGGFWGEAPALPGCASQGDTLEELMANMREAIEGWLAADVPPPRSRRVLRRAHLVIPAAAKRRAGTNPVPT